MITNDSPVAPTFPALYDALVCLFTDFKVFTLALHYKEETDFNESLDVAGTADRLCDRLEESLESVSELMAIDFREKH
jgi:hypothetical protein